MPTPYSMCSAGKVVISGPACVGVLKNEKTGAHYIEFFNFTEKDLEFTLYYDSYDLHTKHLPPFSSGKIEYSSGYTDNYLSGLGVRYQDENLITRTFQLGSLSKFGT